MCIRKNHGWFLIFSLVALGGSAEATVTVTKVNGAVQETDSHYQAGYSATAPSAGFIDPNLTLFNLSRGYTDETEGSRSNMLVFDVYSTATLSATGSQVQVAMVELNGFTLTNGSLPVFVPIAAIGSTSTSSAALTGCTNGGTCYFTDIDPTDSTTPNNTNFSSFRFGAAYSGGSTVRIGIYPKDVCNVLITLSNASLLTSTTGISAICKPAGTVNGPDEQNAVLNLPLNFVIRIATDANTITGVSGQTDDKSNTQNVRFYSSAPNPVTCSSASNMYFPGDGEILVKTGNISATQSAAGAPFDQVVVIARNTSNGALNASSTFRTSNDVVGVVPYNSGDQSVSGFTNTTNLVDNNYSVAFSIRDKAGLVGPFTGTNCTLSSVFTAEIKGFLKESNCFIATAAFRSGKTPPVMLLREFRGKVLLRSALGKKLVRLYYRYSPTSALWLVDHPQYRGPALLALLPLQTWAWLSLRPFLLAFLFVVFFVGVFLGLSYRQSRRFS